MSTGTIRTRKTVDKTIKKERETKEKNGKTTLQTKRD